MSFSRRLFQMNTKLAFNTKGKRNTEAKGSFHFKVENMIEHVARTVVIRAFLPHNKRVFMVSQ